MKKSWDIIKNKLYKKTTGNNPDKSYIENYQQFDSFKNKKKTDEEKKSKELKLKTIYISAVIWAFTISFYLAMFSGFSLIAGKIEGEITTSAKEPFDVYKPEIEIMGQFKDTKYLKYIQRLYVHPKEKNKMMIMIKPNYWGVISKNEKNSIKTKVQKRWG